MHFWIDKRSQGCGFNGRHQEPPAFSGYGRSQRFLVGAGFHPKPMVTPVHRFQSIESVANNGLSRHSRAPPAGYHSVLRTTHCQPPIHYNNSSARQQHVSASSQHHNQIGRHQEMPPVSMVQTPAPNSIKAPSAWGLISKCLGVVSAIGMVLCRYYFHGVNFVYAMCALVGIAFMIVALAGLLTSTHLQTVTTPEANGEVIIASSSSSSSSSRNEHRNSGNQHQSQQLQERDERNVIGGGGGGGNNQVPSLILSPLPCPDSELPPPPYHIAIMLPSQNDTVDSSRGGDRVQLSKDSPPPSYEKAVT